MARIVPEGWQALAATGAAQRELDTLAELAAALPDSLTVYHGVHWTRVHAGHAVVGEIDFVVVNPAGDLLLIEQKSGLLDETDEGLVKQYDRKGKRVATQMARSAENLRNRLYAQCPDAKPALDSLLYCPDYRVRQPGSAGVAPERIVDAARREHLARIVCSLLPPDAPARPVADTVHHFLRDELKLVPDVAALAGAAHTLYTRLAGGLADWARALDFAPFRLRVVGTAGSGKTQLALSVLNDAAAAGRRALYLCYNRPLADHIARIAPVGVEVATYHQFADRLMRDAGTPPDFGVPGAFARMEAFLAGYAPGPAARFDELVIDEGQDFRGDWLDALLRLVKPDGRVWWLEDPLQNLYDRPPVALPGWVTLTTRTNWRSPRDITAWLQKLAGADAVEPGSPLTDSGVDILTYSDTGELMDRTKTAITRGLGAGFKKEAMVVLTYRGREHSLFTPYDRLGPHTLRAFTGGYDLLGGPVYSDGELAIDSVHRFKGQSAPCVVFTEIDFETLDDSALKRLFTGMTRATMKLILVLSERSARALLDRT